MSLPKPLTTQYLRVFTHGTGEVSHRDSESILSLVGVGDQRLSNAQLDDYHWKSRKDFFLTFPLRLQLEARWEYEGDHPQGTSGFGLWNDPFMMTGWRWPSLPQAFWFFVGCPKSLLSLEPQHRHKSGLRAFQVNAWSLSFIKHSPLWLLRAPFWNFKALKNKWLPKLCRTMELKETFLDGDLRQWQSYEILWTAEALKFSVNGKIVQEAPCSIRSRLGLVIWLDNQYLYFDPWKKISWGACVLTQRQALHIRNLSLETLPC